MKIFDIIGQRKLTLIFCMPTFFNLDRQIAVDHSLFLLHVYLGNNLERGFFAYFSNKSKRMLYELGKKEFHSYKKPSANWTGRFNDFHLPFEGDYFKLKKS